ncbi:SH3 domain-containing protein [Bradyrhizobium jicamae]|uniref:SH3 domain-containing protein n=1 Tax=Bradyrhizobium jicamae TaxID=280332 RepID=A0ABS5FK41_9BRAD|nr:SH3 domain-containing protein [Bradyrhizobium jicamae]MBR0796756.1 SH3 domain-containing protein [Bradyrhizobium jicamae]
MKLKGAFVAALLLMPTAALAAPGIVTTTVGLRAGPGGGFPTVDRIPGGARVDIHGCLRGDAWCDVSWSDDRGWVSSAYLEYLYRNHYVYLPDYADEIDIPVVPFVLSSYWSSYYAGRPWYHRRDYWSGYWRSHERFASRMTVDRSAARIGRAAAAREVTTAARPGRNGVAGRVTSGQAIARQPAAREAQGRAANVQARMAREGARTAPRAAAIAHARAQPQMARPMARMREAPRVSAAPARQAMPHIAQPNVSHGSPMNAHAQMPAPRAAAPAMPHVGGGAPHVSAAPHAGAAPGGGGRGHQR